MTAEGEAGPAEVRLGRWVWLTVLGWALGFVLVVAGAVSIESVGLPANQTVVGVGMGLGVGLVQGRYVRERLRVSRFWTPATVLGLALPFLASDLLLGAVSGFEHSLPACVAVGGLLVGVLQARLLRADVARTALWVGAGLAGWGLAVAPIAVGDALADGVVGPWRGLLSFATIIAGGVPLGLVTGAALGPLRRLHAAREDALG